MTRVLVRYKVKPDRAAENEELVRAVYEELHRTHPPRFRYATFQLDAGVTFVHLASNGPPLRRLERALNQTSLASRGPRLVAPTDGFREQRGSKEV